MIDFFHTLGVTTGDNISLFDRGDGIQARFIPEILNEISRNSKKDIIWGFEEPENSYEYKSSDKLARDFVKTYGIDKQIFITTHSFNFLLLESQTPEVEIAKYRIIKNAETGNSQVKPIEHEDLFKTLFMTEDLGQSGDGLIIEKKLAEAKKEIEENNKFKESLAKNQNILYVEGKTDKIILENAWSKLYQTGMNFTIIDCGCAKEINKKLNANTLLDFKNNKIIGLFDFDGEGYDQLNGLHKDRFSNINSNFFRKRKDHLCCYGLLLPVPLSRLNYANQELENKSALSIELIFEDKVLIQSNNLKQAKIAGTNVTRSEFTGDKISFANKIKDFTAEDFVNFKPLFEKIKEILELSV